MNLSKELKNLRFVKAELLKKLFSPDCKATIEQKRAILERIEGAIVNLEMLNEKA